MLFIDDHEHECPVLITKGPVAWTIQLLKDGKEADGWWGYEACSWQVEDEPDLDDVLARFDELWVEHHEADPLSDAEAALVALADLAEAQQAEMDELRTSIDLALADLAETLMEV